MAVFATGDILQITSVQRLFAQTMLNTQFYRVATPDSVGNYVGIIQAVLDEMTGVGNPGNWPARITNSQAASVVTTSVVGQRISPIRSVRVVRPEGLTGTAAGSAITANLAASITKRTALSGRKYVGKMQIGGMPTTSFEFGLIQEDAKAILDTLATTITQNVTEVVSGLVLVPVLYHRLASPNWTQVLTAETQTTARVMRRRTLGLGI